MPAILETVADYITQARVQLQDTYAPAYRYEDLKIISALNFGLARARQLRADLFLDTDGEIPFFTANDASLVPFETMYRQGLLMFVVGYVTLADAEDTTDARAGSLMNAFIVQLNPAAGG